MNLEKSGKLLYDLRRAKGMTQKQIADKLGILPKTVSKWETGRGFPDVSLISDLADILEVNERILLSGNLDRNIEETGNMLKTKFYVCPHCAGFMQGMGNANISCCGKQLLPLEAAAADDGHTLSITETENDFYITFNHEMTKEHFISFAAYVTYDRVLTVKLYPEQDSSVHFAKMYGGRLYFYCNRHGLFEYRLPQKRQNNRVKNSGLTSLMSAFSRAYHNEHSTDPIYRDTLARRLFTDEEYNRLIGYIKDSSNDVSAYINTNLAPTPLARGKFAEECLSAASATGTMQYVILGSGLDTFAYRAGNEFDKIFEIDTPDSIADKKSRLKRAGIEIQDNVKLADADLSCANLHDVLVKNGFDTNKKTVFSCLGLLYYLSCDEVSKLFSDIAEFAADGSGIIFDIADNHIFSSDVPRVKNMLEMAEKSGEPMKSRFGYPELEKMLEKHGFLIYEFLNRDEVQQKYFSSCSDMTAFEHINLVHAVLKPYK